MGGLIETTQQYALEELANVIFEDDNKAHTATISKDKVNLLIVQAIDLQRQNKLSEAINNLSPGDSSGRRPTGVVF